MTIWSTGIDIIAYFGAFETRSGTQTIADGAEDVEYQKLTFYPKLRVLMVGLNIF